MITSTVEQPCGHDSMGFAAKKAQATGFGVKRPGERASRIIAEAYPEPPVMAAEAHVGTPDKRRNEAQRQGEKWWGYSLRSAVREAIEMIGPGGVGRVLVIDRLGIAERTLESWICASGTGYPPGDVLVRLICDERVLPAAAREHLVKRLAAAAGLSVVSEMGMDKAPIARQMCEVTAANGRLATRVAEAMDTTGESGRSISQGEVSRILLEAERVQREAGEMVQALRRRAVDVVGGRLDVKG